MTRCHKIITSEVRHKLLDTLRINMFNVTYNTLMECLLVTYIIQHIYDRYFIHSQLCEYKLGWESGMGNFGGGFSVSKNLRSLKKVLHSDFFYKY